MPAIVLLDQVMVTPVTLVCGEKENVVPLQILGVVLVFVKTGIGLTVNVIEARGPSHKNPVLY